MTDKIIKKMLDDFNLDLLSTYERLTYNRYLSELPKYLSLYKIIRTSDFLSPELQEIKDLENEYRLTINF